jgi:hypothetical protein
MLLARPFLVPADEYLDDMDALREAVDLAHELQGARSEYHDWLRRFVGDMRLGNVMLDPYSLGQAQTELNALFDRERQVVERDRRRQRWTKVEYATMVAGAGVGAAALLLAPPVAPLALSAAGLQFGGWMASKRADLPELPALSGASLFLSAQRDAGWQTVDPAD